MLQKSPVQTSKSELTSHELSRIVDFLRKLRAPFDTGLPAAKPDVYWNVVLELVDAQLRHKPIAGITQEFSKFCDTSSDKFG